MLDFVVLWFVCFVCLFFKQKKLCLVYNIPSPCFFLNLFFLMRYVMLFGVLLLLFVYGLCVFGLGFNCFVCVPFYMLDYVVLLVYVFVVVAKRLFLCLVCVLPSPVLITKRFVMHFFCCLVC